MNEFTGSIFSGELEQDSFYLTKVKTIETASSLSKNQLEKMITYLTNNPNQCTLTVNDQLPVLLEQEEIIYVKQDVETILNELNYSS